MKIVRLPEAGRDEQLKRWDIEPNFRPEMDDEHEAGAEELDFLLLGGWHMVGDPKDFKYKGITTHRGILSEGEKEVIDWEALQTAVELEFGFTVAETEEVYGSGLGRPSKTRLARRLVMDERLLSIQEDGGNMTVLAAVLGWKIEENGKCWTMQKALKRAREARNG